MVRAILLGNLIVTEHKAILSRRGFSICRVVPVAERVLRERPSAGANTTKLPIRFATAYDPYEGWGAFRTGAASWVTSGVTETAVILLTFVDIFPNFGGKNT